MTFLTNCLQYWLDLSNTLNASLHAGFLVLVVLALRQILRPAPKWIHCCLWAMVALRLVMPFSIESPTSLLPTAQVIPREIMAAEPSQQDMPARLDLVANPSYPVEVTTQLPQSTGSFQVRLVLLTPYWLAVAGLLLLHGCYHTLWLRLRLSTATRLRDNVYESDAIPAPFLLGLIRPRVYLPYNLPEQERHLILAHEQAHLRRGDPWWKALGYVLLCVHWFNPLLWLGYHLFCKDLEMACDESVIRRLSPSRRADYSQALLRFSLPRPFPLSHPLAFGEVGVKERVQRVLSYKKPGVFLVILSLVLGLSACAGFLTTPETEQSPIETARPSFSPEELEQLATFPYQQIPVAHAQALTDLMAELAGGVTNAQDSSAIRYPVLLLETRAALDDLLPQLSPLLSQSPYHTASPALKETCASYDDAFWDDQVLALVYLDSQAADDAYALSQVVISLHPRMIHLEIARAPGTQEGVYGLFLLVELPAALVEDAQGLEAYVQPPIKDRVILYSTDGTKKEILTGTVIQTYVFPKEEHDCPTLHLFDNGEFQFHTSLISSYFCHGRYAVDGDRLILDTEDGNYHYEFRITDQGIEFDLAASTEWTWFADLKQGSLGTPQA